MGDLRERLLALASKLASALRAGNDGLSLCELRAEGLDAILEDVFARTCGDGAAVSLVAAGSYGRRAPALYSDVDLRFVPNEAAGAEAVAANVDAVMYPLWDAGMTVGHQVIHIAEVIDLARHDLTTATSLLDLRHVAGPSAPLHSLLLQARRELFEPTRSRELVQRLEAEVRARHDRFGASVYLLEPDVKSGEGGLRDLDVFGWCRKLGPGPSWLSDREDAVLDAAGEFLRRVRNHLHAALGRRSDRLTFDAQELVARAMGYGGVEDDEEAVAAAAERMMQDYYRHARAIARLTTRAFERASAPTNTEGAVAIGAGLVLVAGEVSIPIASLLGDDPALALRAYAVAMRRGRPVSGVAREVLSRATEETSFAPRLRDSEEARSTFVELVCDSQQAPFAKGSLLSELSDTGILHAMIPEFLPVTGRVHHDVYHVYTVDVHSVAAVDCLHALVRGDLRAEHPLASRLAAETTHRRPLLLATLLHDVGKGYPDANGSRKRHAERGAEICDVVLPRLGFSEDDTADARALVLPHLVMYHLATRRDLEDPATIDELARVVRGREGLRDLYLLTVVDITTTAPTAMTSWKAHVLEELYLRADAQFSSPFGARERPFGEHRSRQVSGVAETERTERLGCAAARSWDGPRDELDAFISSMPERWRIATTPEACVLYARTVALAGDGVKVVESPSRGDEHLEVCVVAPDRRGLLAFIAAALTANRFLVLSAQIYSRALGAGAQAVDVFTVRCPLAAPGSLTRVESDLRDLCLGRTTPGDLILARTGSRSPWRDRPTPAVPVEIIFDDHASAHATVVEVFAKDEPGLLFRLAQALADLGLSIVQSRINTEGTKVADVFYVHEVSGGKVTGQARKDEIRSRLQQAVQN